MRASPVPVLTVVAPPEPRGEAMTNATAYHGYEVWKGWNSTDFMAVTPSDRAYFDLEMRGIPVAGEDLLEIGFGNGRFLGWSAARGARLYGTEMSEQGKALAAARDVTVLPTDLSQSVDRHRDRFGVIAAFDVLEHLSLDEIRRMLDQISAMLRPGGHCVARFPNGQSILSGLYQSGDYTHVSTLSASIMTQLVSGSVLEIVRAESSAYPDHGLARKARGVVRTGFEAFLCRLYGFRAPLGPNVTVVLRKTAGTA
ncbi:class I SAM-dependent methyltransferase [Sphingomonas sp. PAMC 26617]|uniref:class I SAM-dependent methyltransferase n=1 Tax=Sphingomonas sp. PAMC 26617 TaxID=1112216 RepID=UPI000289A55D|nr:methyltransferase domain-containing protein [Sphingomonas sp. PAMC 26617]